jgi:dephospho-CoA kinase
MSKIILTLVGQIASGKGTVCDYLKEKYNAGYCRYSTILRDLLDRIYLPHSRKNMQDISTILRQQFGDDLLAKAITEDVKKIANQIVVVDGARRLPDLVHLQKLPNHYLVYINTDERIRYKRIIKRSENPDDQTKTFEEFQQDAQSEAELRIADMKKQANFIINNNGTLKELHQQVDDIIRRLNLR